LPTTLTTASELTVVVTAEPIVGALAPVKEIVPGVFTTALPPNMTFYDDVELPPAPPKMTA